MRTRLWNFKNLFRFFRDLSTCFDFLSILNLLYNYIKKGSGVDTKIAGFLEFPDLLLNFIKQLGFFKKKLRDFRYVPKIFGFLGFSKDILQKGTRFCKWFAPHLKQHILNVRRVEGIQIIHTHQCYDKKKGMLTLMDAI